MSRKCSLIPNAYNLSTGDFKVTLQNKPMRKPIQSTIQKSSERDYQGMYLASKVKAPYIKFLEMNSGSCVMELTLAMPAIKFEI